MKRRFLDAMYAQPLLGIDEVGVGCIAGPVMAAGVMLPSEKYVRDGLLDLGLQDSKKMSPGARERVRDFLKEQCVYMIIKSVSAEEMSRLGHEGALDLLYDRVMITYRKEVRSGDIILDGYSRPQLAKAHLGLVKADDKVMAVAAAACVAKVERDEYMARLARIYPEYGWESNSGYPTPAHLGALGVHGPSDEHRAHTKPVKRVIAALQSLQEEDVGG